MLSRQCLLVLLECKRPQNQIKIRTEESLEYWMYFGYVICNRTNECTQTMGSLALKVTLGFPTPYSLPLVVLVRLSIRDREYQSRSTASCTPLQPVEKSKAWQASTVAKPWLDICCSVEELGITTEWLNSSCWWLTDPPQKKTRCAQSFHSKFKMSYYCLQKSETLHVHEVKIITRMLSYVSRVRHNLIGLSCKQH